MDANRSIMTILNINIEYRGKMMKAIKMCVWLTLLLLCFSGAGFASDEKQVSTPEKPEKKETESEHVISVPISAPLFSPLFANVPVASVEDDPITLRELERGLEITHKEEDVSPSATTPGKISYREIIDRLVTIRLIVHESRTIGLDELPEYKEEVEAEKQQYLRTALLRHAVAQVKPDDSEVEAFYKEYAREYKLSSALFVKQDNANKALEDIKGGKDFSETITKCIESQQATGMSDSKYLKRSEMLPEIAQAVSSMPTGSVSPVIRIERGFVLMKLEDSRIPTTEDTAAREMARQDSLRRQKAKAISELKAELFKKYVKLNKKLLESIDYEAKPGFFSKQSAFDKYLKDDRVIAEIQGEDPITVSMLTKAIDAKLYHGVKAAYEQKTINSRKLQTFGAMIEKKLELKEARNLSLDKTDEAQADLTDIEYSNLFSLFIGKVVMPDIHISNDDITGYYESHQKDYTIPSMMRLNSLAFKNKKQAEAALARLRQGTDFDWMKANAAGVDQDAQELTGEDMPVLVSSMPEGLQKAVDGARPGDYRLYSDPNGRFYALLITQVIPPAVKPLQEVGGQIKQIVLADKINKSVRTWAEKLRAAYTIKIYLGDKKH
jgi:PPIC-type PPIASE domain